ncbi:hypothetical protein VPG91_21650 [Nitrospirillum amazonense]|uniref:hypothetical protein n=1 Tax=Nitrospirillum amazonense TaxID=28077 RepID=UPI002DD433F1|nr:hypothetical protein [Nitrospirillum amazonense]MEC4593620.1 hypothetical protein [Nitrospirillum amazonense]
MADGTYAGISPFISNEAAVAAGALVVPLFVMNCSGTTKVGILVTLASGDTSVTQLYEFDTGGKGFWASAPALSAGKATDLVTQYTSGITYLAAAAEVTVTLTGIASGGAAPTISTSAYIGLVEEIYQLPKKTAGDAASVGKKDGNEELSSFPIYDYFFGDFGVSLAATSTQPPNLTHPIPVSVVGYNQVSILGVLSQLQSGTEQFFIVDLANTDAQGVWDGQVPSLPDVGAQDAVTKVGRLIIGGGTALQAAFSHPFQLQPGAGPYVPPNATAGSGFLTGSEQQIAGTLTVQVGSQTPQTLATTLTMDTGCPQVTLHAGTQLTADYESKPTTLTATDIHGADVLLYPIPDKGGGSAHWDDTPNPNQPDSPGYVNSALEPFFSHPTAFWLFSASTQLPTVKAPGAVLM